MELSWSVVILISVLIGGNCTLISDDSSLFFFNGVSVVDILTALFGFLFFIISYGKSLTSLIDTLFLSSNEE